MLLVTTSPSPPQTLTPPGAAEGKSEYCQSWTALHVIRPCAGPSWACLRGVRSSSTLVASGASSGVSTGGLAVVHRIIILLLPFKRNWSLPPCVDRKHGNASLKLETLPKAHARIVSGCAELPPPLEPRCWVQLSDLGMSNVGIRCRRSHSEVILVSLQNNNLEPRLRHQGDLIQIAARSCLIPVDLAMRIIAIASLAVLC